MNKNHLITVWVSVVVTVAFCLLVMNAAGKNQLNDISDLIWFLCVIIIIQSISRGFLMQMTKRPELPKSTEEK